MKMIYDKSRFHSAHKIYELQGRRAKDTVKSSFPLWKLKQVKLEHLLCHWPHSVYV